LLSKEGGRGCRATDTWASQVLESNQNSRDTSALVSVRVSERVADSDTLVLGDKTSGGVLLELTDEVSFSFALVRGACARNLDGGAVRASDTITVTSSGGVQVGGVAEFRSESSNLANTGLGCGRRCRCRSGRWGSDRCWWRSATATGLNDGTTWLVSTFKSRPSGDKVGSNSGASLSRTIQVLEGDEDGGDSRGLISRGASSGEVESTDVGVIEDTASTEVLGDFIDEESTVRGTRARDKNTIESNTITSSGGSGAAFDTERGRDKGINQSTVQRLSLVKVRQGRNGRGYSQESTKGRGSSEFHDCGTKSWKGLGGLDVR